MWPSTQPCHLLLEADVQSTEGDSVAALLVRAHPCILCSSRLLGAAWLLAPALDLTR